MHLLSHLFCSLFLLFFFLTITTLKIFIFNFRFVIPWKLNSRENFSRIDLEVFQISYFVLNLFPTLRNSWKFRGYLMKAFVHRILGQEYLLQSAALLFLFRILSKRARGPQPCIVLFLPRLCEARPRKIYSRGTRMQRATPADLSALAPLTN